MTIHTYIHTYTTSHLHKKIQIKNQGTFPPAY